jgi:UDP-glucuronate decarboxylase
MQIFVTGAAGFISFHLIRTLLDRGFGVIGIDNFKSGQARNISDLEKYSPRFRFIKMDVIEMLNPTSFKSLEVAGIGDIKQIFHMACPASPPIYQIDPINTLDTCYIGTRNALELGLRFGAKVLIASTSECYGDPEIHPQPESYRGNVNTFGPRSCYDEGKRVSESLAYAYSLKGLEVRIARIFNTYGPRMSPADGRVLTNFIEQALKSQNLTIYGDGKQTRSICYCEDLVRGLIKLMDSNVQGPINLGSEFEVTVNELANKVIALTKSTSTISFMPLPQDDPKIRRPDITRAKNELNWKPEIKPETGIGKMIEFHRDLMS